jgi:hypothetical protein
MSTSVCSYIGGDDYDVDQCDTYGIWKMQRFGGPIPWPDPYSGQSVTMNCTWTNGSSYDEFDYDHASTHLNVSAHFSGKCHLRVANERHETINPAPLVVETDWQFDPPILRGVELLLQDPDACHVCNSIDRSRKSVFTSSVFNIGAGHRLEVIAVPAYRRGRLSACIDRMDVVLAVEDTDGNVERINMETHFGQFVTMINVTVNCSIRVFINSTSFGAAKSAKVRFVAIQRHSIEPPTGAVEVWYRSNFTAQIARGSHGLHDYGKFEANDTDVNIENRTIVVLPNMRRTRRTIEISDSCICENKVGLEVLTVVPTTARLTGPQSVRVGDEVKYRVVVYDQFDREVSDANFAKMNRRADPPEFDPQEWVFRPQAVGDVLLNATLDTVRGSLAVSVTDRTVDDVL